jgi:hypothetical protein
VFGFWGLGLGVQGLVFGFWGWYRTPHRNPLSNHCEGLRRTPRNLTRHPYTPASGVGGWVGESERGERERRDREREREKRLHSPLALHAPIHQAIQLGEIWGFGCEVSGFFFSSLLLTSVEMSHPKV